MQKQEHNCKMNATTLNELFHLNFSARRFLTQKRIRRISRNSCTSWGMWCPMVTFIHPRINILAPSHQGNPHFFPHAHIPTVRHRQRDSGSPPRGRSASLWIIYLSAGFSYGPAADYPLLESKREGDPPLASSLLNRCSMEHLLHFPGNKFKKYY